MCCTSASCSVRSWSRNAAVLFAGDAPPGPQPVSSKAGSSAASVTRRINTGNLRSDHADILPDRASCSAGYSATTRTPITRISRLLRWHFGPRSAGGRSVRAGKGPALRGGTAMPELVLNYLDVTKLAVAGFLARYRGATLTAYQGDLRCYLRWCAEVDVQPLRVTRGQLEL